MTKTLFATILLGAAVGGCSMIHKSTDTPASGGSTAAATGPFAGTMAEAPLYHAGATIDGPAGCNTSGYAKFDVPAGQPVKMDVEVKGPAGACLSVSYLKSTGGAVDGMMKELCIDKNAHETWDVTGLEGGSFVQVLEEPPCKNASISIALH